MASLSKVPSTATAAVVVLLLLLLLLLSTAAETAVSSSSWCVARSDASEQALQTALDYACWAGADCAPLQSSGLCFLPNTIQAHASYAFNSYYQRKSMAPGSCDFSGIATIAKSDPSYGSCVYPSSPSTAGGTVTGGGTGMGTGTTTSTPMPTIGAPPPPFSTTSIGNGGLTPGAVLPNTENSKASPELSVSSLLLVHVSFCLSARIVLRIL